eukprot:gene30779-38043_t
MGTAMSITAFPVLARLLKEGGLIYTRPGALAMGAAAFDDATAWCLLILSISIANARNLNIAVLNRLVRWVEKERPALNTHLFALTICLVFLSAWTTNLLGVHFIFGAFIFGLIVPRDSSLWHVCLERMELFVLTITLPLYFALSGLRTDVTTIQTGAEGAMLLLVCFTACAGKMCGAGVAAFVNGMSVRESSVVAVLMNTRGLVELIVLNLGLESRILSTRTFSVMVVMALFTTFLTWPIVNCIYPEHMRVKLGDERVEDATSMAADSSSGAYQLSRLKDSLRMSVVVDRAEHMQSLIRLLAYLLPRELGASLSVTALHFVEPTRSMRDQFVTLNEEGRLIRVEEETTDIEYAVTHRHDPTAARGSELLPLCVFCDSMDATVNAFRILGAPSEFPAELKALSANNECALVLLPWRPRSEYFQTLMWESIATLDVPLALLVDRSVTHLAGDVSADNSRLNSPVEETKEQPSELESGGGATGSQRHHAVPWHPRTSRTRSVNLSSDRIEDTSRHTSVPLETKHIAAVLTNSPLDAAIISLAGRMASAPASAVSLYIPSDIKSAPNFVIKRLAAFLKEIETKQLSNVHIAHMMSASTDVKGMYRESYSASVDLFVCAFLEPPVNDLPSPLDVEQGAARTAVVEMALDDSPALSASPRSKHSYFSIVPSVFRTSREGASQLGESSSAVPAKYQHQVNLEYVELGGAQLLVLHETKGARPHSDGDEGKESEVSSMRRTDSGVLRRITEGSEK